MKLAAAHKVEGMISNALVVHDKSRRLNANEGASSEALMKSAMVMYELMEPDVEPCGGFFWIWKKMMDGSILRMEGIWLHSRLIAANISQLFVVVAIAVAWSEGLSYMKNTESNYSEKRRVYKWIINEEKGIILE
jgi:hypothetical protein